LTAKPTQKERNIIISHKIARMATVDGSGNPLVLPVCFAYDGRCIYSPIDKKPKRVSSDKLKRVRNVLGNPNVSLLIDKYVENWNNLYYVIIVGRADVLNGGEEYERSLKILSDKYDQYRKMGLENLGAPVIKITPEKIISWGDL